eukprot:jgi/Tetstr1/464517/TSEL_009275.t1
MLNAGVAVRNPDYDPTVLRSEMLTITHPERIFSFDETSVELDCTKDGKRKGDRIVRDGKHDRGEGLSTKSSATATVAARFATKVKWLEALKMEDFIDMIRPAFEHGFTYDRNMMGWRKEGLMPFNRNELWNLREELERID